VLVVGVQCDGPTTADPTGITYNGVSMTKAVSLNDGSNASSSLWFLASPATGANDVVVTYSSNQRFTSGSVSFSGASSTYGVTGSNQASTGDPTVTVTTTSSAGFLVDSIYQNNGGLGLSPDAGQTSRYNEASFDGFDGWGSTKSVTSVGSYTMSWSQDTGAADRWISTTLEVKEYVAAGSGSAKVLVVAGGGGGGANAGGGGGAGGVVYHASHTVSAGSYSITVGGGGSGVTGAPGSGTNGSDSVFSDGANTITAVGGGFGRGATSPYTQTGGDGGSGGGGSYNATAGGSATQGNSGGGTGYGYGGGTGDDGGDAGGGGGGAGAVGATTTTSTGGAGGIGIADASVGNLLSIASAPDTSHIAGGGGGGGVGTSGGAGGDGGGGTGRGGAGGGPVDATANTGGGGGGDGSSNGSGAGGSGIVIIAYTTSQFTHTGGNATGTSGSETWVKFTSSGTLTLSAAGGKLLSLLGVGQ
jgi:hypothetical protein